MWPSWIYLYMKSFYGIVDLGSYLIGLLDDRDVSQNKKKPRQISHHSSQFQFQKFIVTKKFHRGFRDIYDGYLFTEKVFAPDGDANLFEMVLAQDTYRN